MLKKLNIKKFLYFTAAFLIILFSHSYTFVNCIECINSDSQSESHCCCKPEKESEENCCSVPETQTSHNCVFCDSDNSFVLEDKLISPKLNEFQHLIPVEPVQVSSDDLNPVNTFSSKKYPELTYSLLKVITVLRI